MGVSLVSDKIYLSSFPDEKTLRRQLWLFKELVGDRGASGLEWKASLIFKDYFTASGFCMVELEENFF